MRRFVVLIAALAATPLSPLQAAEAQNGLLVEPAGALSFEVQEGGDLGAQSVWCAAADYAEKVLRLPPTARLYVEVPRGEARRLQGRPMIRFTADPDAIAPSYTPILALTIRQEGSNLSVGHAIGFCADRRLTNP